MRVPSHLFFYDNSKDVDNDITLAATPTSPTTARNLDDENTQTPLHYDYSKDSENDLTVNTEDLATSPTTATNLSTQPLLNENDHWPDDATNDIAMDTEDLAVQNELPTTNGPATAVELGDPMLNSHIPRHPT
ncbi:hypothetical protein N7516_006689 [Penicillium verrucosum]|uniref:uncharacterized protein n=1 Tax=Penicillium verrucosum TaxID=60171 RepID=UPI0025455FBB|nr:uncharacterized protein N7516_006689 [Penicillium verrucosum]KAJ5932200.1 hypothetical protein N7516_006689 [Penicillium verrucosum]